MNRWFDESFRCYRLGDERLACDLLHRDGNAWWVVANALPDLDHVALVGGHVDLKRSLIRSQTNRADACPVVEASDQGVWLYSSPETGNASD